MATERRPPRRPRLGVRARAAVAALVASALPFGVAAYWVGRSVHDELEREATDQARMAVENIAGKVPSGPDEEYQTREVTPAQIVAYGGAYADGAAPRTQRLTVHVLVDPREADRAGDTITRILGCYLAPGASLFVALTAYLVTGLALRPVEAIRRRMAEIGDGAFHERVPVPKARDGISRLAATTNVTLGKLERALGEQRRLVADASHELRSSLEVPLAHPAATEPPSGHGAQLVVRLPPRRPAAAELGPSTA
ncbi:hypothetical protein [Kitasatospora sp. NBC_01287]|uniref:hypothetical protein n=1 Tax=Kitasatospora sp. NBC_01287 TaxID=2903573 RepID=UPI002B1DBA76|nr:hypothetical protein [Kitasatospora sp. NBC_01287]